jgi:hypothetical protein
MSFVSRMKIWSLYNVGYSVSGSSNFGTFFKYHTVNFKESNQLQKCYSVIVLDRFWLQNKTF